MVCSTPALLAQRYLDRISSSLQEAHKLHTPDINSYSSATSTMVLIKTFLRAAIAVLTIEQVDRTEEEFLVLKDQYCHDLREVIISGHTKEYLAEATHRLIWRLENGVPFCLEGQEPSNATPTTMDWLYGTNAEDVVDFCGLKGLGLKAGDLSGVGRVCQASSCTLCSPCFCSSPARVSSVDVFPASRLQWHSG